MHNPNLWYEPMHPPPSYASPIHNTEIELPTYSEGPLYANYRSYMKASSTPSNDPRDADRHLDLERPNGEEQQSFQEQSAAREGKKCKSWLRYFKPSEARKAIKPATRRKGEVGKSIVDFGLELIAIGIMVFLHVIYVLLVLGAPAIMIWAAVRSFSHKE